MLFKPVKQCLPARGFGMDGGRPSRLGSRLYHLFQNTTGAGAAIVLTLVGRLLERNVVFDAISDHVVCGETVAWGRETGECYLVRPSVDCVTS